MNSIKNLKTPVPLLNMIILLNSIELSEDILENVNVLFAKNLSELYESVSKNKIDIILTDEQLEDEFINTNNHIDFISVTNRITNNSQHYYIKEPLTIQNLNETLKIITKHRVEKNELLCYEKWMEEYFYIIDENVKLLSATDDMKLIFISTNMAEALKYNPIEMLDKYLTDYLHPETDEGMLDHIFYIVQAGNTWKGELQFISRTGETLWLFTTMEPSADGKISIICHNITNKKKLDMALITDDLTGIYNRRFFNKKIKEYLNSAKRRDENISMIIFDIDNFRPYNDHYGHLKGDEILRIVAANVSQSCQRADDYLFRLGGEEFAILFQVDEEYKAEAFAKKIKKSIDDLMIPHEYSDYGKLTVSMGVTSHKAELFETSEDLYTTTDLKLYEAKNRGKNTYRF